MTALKIGFLYPLAVLGLVLLTTSCGAAAPPVPTATPLSPPDTTAAAVMEYLQQVNYQETWELWPGKGEKYAASAPHGMLLTTYLNSAAFAALNDKAGSMPDGAIIVKENYTAKGVLDATTIMYKVAGFNPEHNDWFWTKVAADGTIKKEGKVEGCQTCHGGKKDNDYVMTGVLK